MSLDSLPDVALLQIFSKCKVKDIGSVQRTNRKLCDHITNFRAWYSKFPVSTVEIRGKADNKYEVRVEIRDDKEVVKTVGIESLRNVLDMLDPHWFISVDNEVVQNMNRKWWIDRRILILYDVQDYRRYLQYFDRCRIISLTSHWSINLTEILNSMEMKTLHWLSLSGYIHCTDEDIRKIGRLSNKLDFLELNTVSKSSNISNDAVLDLIEIGSFVSRMSIKISRIEDFENIEKCLENRRWVDVYDKQKPNKLYLEHRNGSKFYIMTDELEDDETINQ